ncbi:MAG TPA: hypothetical protein VNP04_30640 [Alphaproteobacteria bacterium]|nr:hypothetical protein [Alphaproteobacteria bacterium]
MQPATERLNKNQQRQVSTTMVLVDESLALCKRLLRQGPEQGLLYTIQDDLSPSQKARLLSHLQEMRDVLSHLDGQLQLTHKVSSLTREIAGELAYLWTIIEECASHRLRGYGPVDESLKAELDPRLVQLITSIRAMEHIVGRPTQVVKVR